MQVPSPSAFTHVFDQKSELLLRWRGCDCEGVYASSEPPHSEANHSRHCREDSSGMFRNPYCPILNDGATLYPEFQQQPRARIRVGSPIDCLELELSYGAFAVAFFVCRERQVTHDSAATREPNQPVCEPEPKTYSQSSTDV